MSAPGATDAGALYSKKSSAPLAVVPLSLIRTVPPSAVVPPAGKRAANRNGPPRKLPVSFAVTLGLFSGLSVNCDPTFGDVARVVPRDGHIAMNPEAIVFDFAGV